MDKCIIPYGKQQILDEDIAAVTEVLKSDFLTQGPAVSNFESSFASYVGAKYAVAVTNGTAALHLSAMALSLQAGKKVITSPITFVASANCVLYCGGEVEFADIEPKTYCLDPVKVEELIKKDPTAYSGIIPVSFAGYPANLEALSKIAKKYGLWIIEDACHAPGANFVDSQGKTQKCGNGEFAELTVFSFHPVKHIACGEGGMITTNDVELYKRLNVLRSHGILREKSALSKYDGGWYYEMHELGYNYRISDILCALGSSQLKRASVTFERRKEIAQLYDRSFKDLPIVLPLLEKNVEHAYHLYVIQTERRAELYNYLKENDIYTQVHYIPVHQQPYYLKKYGQQKFPNADSFYERCLSLPMYHSLTSSEQNKVIELIRKFYGV